MCGRRVCGRRVVPAEPRGRDAPLRPLTSGTGRLGEGLSAGIWSSEVPTGHWSREAQEAAACLGLGPGDCRELHWESLVQSREPRAGGARTAL